MTGPSSSALRAWLYLALSFFASCAALAEDSRHRLVALGFSDYHFFWVTAIAQDAVSLEGLALVGRHVAFHFDLVLFFHFNYDGDIFTNLIAVRMTDNMLLL